MNYVFLSPAFPLNYYRFCVALKRAGATVLGIGDTPYDELRQELREALTEYYRVDDLHNREQLKWACEHFIHRYGSIDILESHNEYWLETDAWLRSEYGIRGLKNEDMPVLKAKSRMKEVYRQAGIAVARGTVVTDRQAAEDFVAATGYPLVVKPDTGVGAGGAYRIANAEDLTAFFNNLPPEPYFMEEYVEGQIQTFDGLVDKNGEVVFFTSLAYHDGIMDNVLYQLDVTFHSARVVPADMEEAGRRAVAAFGIRERFFHLEFFRCPDGRIVALEANMRPPGGPILDMMNFANDIDIFQEYANMIVRGTFDQSIYDPRERKYFCAFVSRRNSHSYLMSHNDILQRFGTFIVAHEPLPAAYSAAMGDYFYLLRSTDWDALSSARDSIRALA